LSDSKAERLNTAEFLKIRDATLLASKGKGRCICCKKIADQTEQIVTTFAGNVLLSICPTCIKGHIRIEARDGKISVRLREEKPRIVLCSSLSSVKGLSLAKPKPKRIF
jgi:hypothetical protein